MKSLIVGTLFHALFTILVFGQTDVPRAVSTNAAPAAIGPYSQAIIAGNFVFVSGQLGLDPESGAFVDGGIREQTRRALDNIKAILVKAGTDLRNVVSCSVFLADMNDFSSMNDVYAGYFPLPAPARATVEVARLPKDGLVEISCIALVQ